MTNRTVPLLDISQENGPHREAFLAALTEVLDSGRFLFGPDVAELEREMAQLCDVPNAVACASGSDALLLAMMALDIGPGDEVIVPSFTFFATASAAWRVGARPVFVDIDPHTFNLDPQAVAAAVTPATRAIIAVHLFGQCADLDPLAEIAKQHDLTLIEDAAQSIGATYRDRPCGGIGDIGCFSFYPTKNLGGMGDGGMLTARDADLADRLGLFAAHGMRPRYYHEVVGINSRLDTFQAAVLRVKLGQLEAWNRARAENAQRYDALFAEAGLSHVIGTPPVDPACGHVWNQYTIRVAHGRRDELRQALQQAGVGSEIYYPVPLHRQACFASLGYPDGSLPHTEQAAREVLSIPISPVLTANDQRYVVERIGAFFGRSAVAA